MSTFNEAGEEVLEPGDEGYVKPTGGEGDGGEGDGDNGGKEKKPVVEELPDAKKARLDRMSEQHKKKYPELYDEPIKKDKKTEELDYGQKAFLVAKGIEDADEVALVKDIMASSGKELEEVLGSGYFKTELKDLRDGKEAADAVPGNKNRAGAGAANTVEYWIAKGGLPANNAENIKLRQDIVNARMKKATDANHFTDNPVVGG